MQPSVHCTYIWINMFDCIHMNMIRMQLTLPAIFSAKAFFVQAQEIVAVMYMLIHHHHWCTQAPINTQLQRKCKHSIWNDCNDGASGKPLFKSTMKNMCFYWFLLWNNDVLSILFTFHLSTSYISENAIFSILAVKFLC